MKTTLDTKKPATIKKSAAKVAATTARVPMKDKERPEEPAAATLDPAKSARICRALKITGDDLQTIATHAGVDALDVALERAGRVQFPVEFESPPPGTRAVFIPEALFNQVETAGKLAGVSDAVSKLAAQMLESCAQDRAGLLRFVADLAAAADGQSIPEAAAFLPIYLPARKVQLLRELCDATRIEGGADAYADTILGGEIEESLKSKRGTDGVPGSGLDGAAAMIHSLWTFGDDEAEATDAMLAVVERWNGKGGVG